MFYPSLPQLNVGLKNLAVPYWLVQKKFLMQKRYYRLILYFAVGIQKQMLKYYKTNAQEFPIHRILQCNFKKRTWQLIVYGIGAKSLSS